MSTRKLGSGLQPTRDNTKKYHDGLREKSRHDDRDATRGYRTTKKEKNSERTRILIRYRLLRYPPGGWW